MGDYFCVISLQSPLDHDGLRRLAHQACLDLYRADWLRGYVATDGARMLCWYSAPDAEAVRFVLRQQGFPGSVVWPAGASGAVDAAPIDVGRDCVVVEFHADGPIDAARAGAAGALRAGGRTVTRTFTAKSGARLVLVVEGRDATPVAACLQSAGMAPSAVWRCVEFDPRPPKLFRSHAPAQASVRTEAPGVFETRTPLAAGKSAGEGAEDVMDAVIIGAGLAGICALQRCLRMGLRVRLYEAGSDVGGVWYWNRYPGARVDSETYTYGFSLPEELLAEWEWTELFAPQPEIERYLRFVVDRLDLRRHMSLDTRVVVASYDETGGYWRVETHTGERVTARYLIAATGSLSAAQLPDYPGIDAFAGESHHTARWPAGGVELSGKRVGVVGTGATGVQVIQTIAGEVRHLTVFQRTPTYCLPQRNRVLTAEERLEIQRDWLEILARCRASYGGFIHDFDPRPGLAVSADTREAQFEALWHQPGLAFWLGNFADLMMNPEVNAHASDFVRRKIRARVHDPEIARRLLPDHPFGTKRVPLENGYYEVYNRENVRLVDLRETPIVRITRGGIVTSREEHRLDVIVYATGFDAATGALTRIDIRGEGGRTLADTWRQGPKTYLGLLVAGFPNLFVVNGPHNAAALCNAGRCIEQNVDWIARCIERMRTQGLMRIVPTAAAAEEWTAHVEDVAQASLLGQMRDSWFFGANTPGKARRVAIYAAGARQYRERCEDVARAGYVGCTMW
jgi:cation diffusion facilitator CzcD-associated flavoprotein CzcO